MRTMNTKEHLCPTQACLIKYLDKTVFLMITDYNKKIASMIITKNDYNKKIATKKSFSIDHSCVQ